jgi:hypothetical protein
MSKIHTPSDHLRIAPTLAPAVRTTGANGAGVDCRGFEDALVVLNVGAHDHTTGDETLDVKLQESSDNGSSDAFADVAGAAFVQIAAQTIDATKGNSYVLNVKLSKRKRYLRAVGTAAGTTPSTAYGVQIELINPRNSPVTQDAAAISV